ncbi:hypothetical protein [Phormidium nigroviride]
MSIRYHVLAIAHDDDPFVPILSRVFINGNRPDMIKGSICSHCQV